LVPDAKPNPEISPGRRADLEGLTTIDNRNSVADLRQFLKPFGCLSRPINLLLIDIYNEPKQQVVVYIAAQDSARAEVVSRALRAIENEPLI
jgi:hypothetical protein